MEKIKSCYVLCINIRFRWIKKRFFKGEKYKSIKNISVINWKFISKYRYKIQKL